MLEVLWNSSESRTKEKNDTDNLHLPNSERIYNLNPSTKNVKTLMLRHNETAYLADMTPSIW